MLGVILPEASEPYDRKSTASRERAVIHESTEETERAVIFQEYQNIMSEAVRPNRAAFSFA